MIETIREYTLERMNSDVILRHRMELVTESISAMEEYPQAHISNYRVGAALECGEGKKEIYAAGNIETDVHNAIHAEVGVSLRALYNGEKKAWAISVAVKGKPFFPCGICRQFLYEKWGGDLIIRAVGVQEAHDRVIVKQTKLDSIFYNGFKRQEK